jgi:phosphoribosyl-AMP cyclohydrolase
MDTIIDIEEGTLLMPQFAKRGGLLPVAVQETGTERVLMLASVNEEALHKTFETGLATFWSTSRNQLWTKGETSGDYLQIDEILVDCDQDALVYKVTMTGSGVCHTFNQYGEHRKACFYRTVNIETKNLEFIEK